MSSERPYYPPPRPPHQPRPPAPPGAGQPAFRPAQPAGPAYAAGQPGPMPSYPQAYGQGYAQAQGAKPSPYWPLTVISLFSGLIGIVALIFSFQVDARWKAGDAQGARRASQLALWIGIAGIAFIVV